MEMFSLQWAKTAFWAKTMFARHWGKLLLLQAVLLVGLGYLLSSMTAGGNEKPSPPKAERTASESPKQAEAWTCSMHPQIRRSGPGDCPLCGMDLIPVESSSAAPAPMLSGDAEAWTCSMHPQIRRTGPGDCPLCGMDLIPVESSSAAPAPMLSVAAEAAALMNVETVPVREKPVETEVEMVGKVAYDETRLGHITAWVDGRIDRMFVDYAGVNVKKGDHLVYIYSEELYSAQAELIDAVGYSRAGNGSERSLSPGGIDMAEATRNKLRMLGLTAEQIERIEEQERPTTHLTVFAPFGGVVIEKHRRQGERVSRGDLLYTVADLGQVWVNLDAYESDLPWIRYGQNVSFTVEAFPGETFIGRIGFINPMLDETTRTVKVRVIVPNPDGKLKPGMFTRGKVRARLGAGGELIAPELRGKWISPMHPWIVKDAPGNCDVCGMKLVEPKTLGYETADVAYEPLVIPASAPLITGKRAVVYVEVPDADQPTFEGREVVLGPRAGDYYIVLEGLDEGELVVVRGNFKIDSEIQIQAKPSMMSPEGAENGHPPHAGTHPHE